MKKTQSRNEKYEGSLTIPMFSAWTAFFTGLQTLKAGSETPPDCEKNLFENLEINAGIESKNRVQSNGNNCECSHSRHHRDASILCKTSNGSKISNCEDAPVSCLVRVITTQWV